jgi:hypothetical protein
MVFGYGDWYNGACTQSQFYENWGGALNFYNRDQFYVLSDTSNTWNDRPDGDVVYAICEQWREQLGTLAASVIACHTSWDHNMSQHHLC